MNKRSILFLGTPVSSGWGRATLEYLRALVKTGHDIAFRPVFMSGEPTIQDPLFYELMEKTYEPDILIQNVLPHFMEYDGRFKKNIGLIHTETRYWMNVWPERLKLMDEIWVPSEADGFNVQVSCSPRFIETIHIPTDVTRYTKEYPEVLPELKDSYNFYWIGELIHRKGLDVLLKAFHIAFDPTENVNLVIKTHKQGLSPEQVAQQVNHLVNSVKTELRIFPKIEHYKQELVIPNYLSEDQLYGLHKTCDCFVMPSRGESCCLPALDAAGFGKSVIGTDNTGMADFIVDKIRSFDAPVISPDAPIADLYTAREIYQEPDVLHLVELMRKMYEQGKGAYSAVNAATVARNYSYEAVAKKMNEALSW